MLDIDQIRKDCAACARRIHFNNAGSAMSPDAVTRAVIEHLQKEQALGGYEAAREARAQADNFYRALAGLLNCDPSEIAYSENATRAWDQAIYSLDWQAGDEILTGDMEYASNYLGLLHLARQKGVRITTIARNASGLVDTGKLQQAIGPKTRLIALTHIASQRGDIQPAAEVGRLAREHGLWYLLDACQSAGHLQLDVEELQCDFLCGTGRKYLRGPRGTGFLYVRQSRLEELEPLFIDLHAARWTGENAYNWREGALRFENFERSVAGQIGLGVAVDYALSLGMPEIETRIRALASNLRERLAALPGIRVLEQSPAGSGIVTFQKNDEAADRLQARLQEAGINTSVAAAANTRLDIDQEGRGDVNRASLHYYNTEDEIEEFVRALAG